MVFNQKKNGETISYKYQNQVEQKKTEVINFLSLHGQSGQILAEDNTRRCGQSAGDHHRLYEQQWLVSGGGSSEWRGQSRNSTVGSDIPTCVSYRGGRRERVSIPPSLPPSLSSYASLSLSLSLYPFLFGYILIFINCKTKLSTTHQ